MLPGGVVQCVFFRRSPAGARSKPAGWGRIVQRLISNGHSLDQIAGYTPDQVRLFAEAVDKEVNEQARIRMIAARSANIKSDDFKKLMKEFS